MKHDDTSQKSHSAGPTNYLIEGAMLLTILTIVLSLYYDSVKSKVPEGVIVRESSATGVDSESVVRTVNSFRSKYLKQPAQQLPAAPAVEEPVVEPVIIAQQSDQIETVANQLQSIDDIMLTLPAAQKNLSLSLSGDVEKKIDPRFLRMPVSVSADEATSASKPLAEFSKSQ